MTTPSITPAQVLAFVTLILGMLVSQGLITNGTEKLLGGVAAIIVPVAVMFADAHIRHGRATGPAAAKK